MTFKRILFLSHRYLGVPLCLLFVAWYVSGIFMMYVRMPQLRPEEALDHVEPLAFSARPVTPDQALRSLNVAEDPRRIRMGMVLNRPVYRFLFSKGGWVTVFADSAATRLSTSPQQALTIGRPFAQAVTASPIHLGCLTRADQWTLSSSLDPYRPLHKIGLSDGKGTEIYVSQPTGEVVQKTTRLTRCLAYFSAITHWLYVAPLRRHNEMWRQLVIWLAAFGAVMCVLGITIGMMRVSPRKRYRLRAHAQTSIPYISWKRGHHIAGLLFGVVTFTWVLSGMLSLNPGRWSPSRTPTPGQTRGVAGGKLSGSRFKIDVETILSKAPVKISPKQVEFVLFQGRPFYVAYENPSRSLLIPADGSLARTREAFTQEELTTAAQAAMPKAALVGSELLRDYDAYYYDRNGAKRLPVLRAQFNDPDKTWLYLDSHTGAVVEKYVRLSRLERWLYHGLHSLDFPFLYYHRPGWDILVLFLSLGGASLSLLGAAIAWRRLRGQPNRSAVLPKAGHQPVMQSSYETKVSSP